MVKQGRTILSDVDFTLGRGEFVYLVGPTGAGKTSVLKLIVFEERPTRGIVYVGNYDSQTLREHDIPELRRKVGVCFQDLRLLHDRTVFENVAFALEVTGARRSEVKRRTLELLALADLVHRRDALPGTLSGGEQQRVALARALVNDPFVLVVDEPTANLDSESTDRVVEMLYSANAQGTSVVMATHDTVLAGRHGRRVLSLEGGRLRRFAN